MFVIRVLSTIKLLGLNERNKLFLLMVITFQIVARLAATERSAVFNGVSTC